MKREIIIGTALALLLYLIRQGQNLLPFVFIIGIGVFLFYFMENRGGKIRILDPIQAKKGMISFDAIGGQEKAKNELLEALNFMVKEKEVAHLGIKPLKGVLLSGPPGTGKTLLARAAASYADACFVATSGSEFVEMYAGVGAKRIRQLFQEARHHANRANKKHAIVFIDEIDILGSRRGQVTSHMEYDQTLNQLLVQMDGLSVADDVRILILAATNRSETLDQALIRPGRFDRIVKVDLPTKNGRLQILKIHTKNRPLSAKVNLEKIAAETFGFSGAHLESLVNEAAILAMRDGSTNILNRHFREAIEKVMLGEKGENIPGIQEKERISIHESGHALLSEILKSGSVANITITPRGGTLGYVRQTPVTEKYLHTEAEIKNLIAIKLGGSLAEDQIFGSKSTGAIQDLQEAYNYCRLLIRSGMSKLGYVETDTLPQNLLHDAIKDILEEVQVNVVDIINEHKELLLAIANKLLRQETLNGVELRDLIESKIEGSLD